MRRRYGGWRGGERLGSGSAQDCEDGSLLEGWSRRVLPMFPTGSPAPGKARAHIGLLRLE